VNQAKTAINRREFEHGIEALRIALELAQQQRKTQLVASVQMQLGGLLERTGKHNEAIPLLLQALTNADSENAPIEYSEAMNSLTSAYANLGDWQETAVWSQKRIDFESSHDSTSIAMSISANSLAGACMKLKQYERACKAFVIVASYTRDTNLLKTAVKGFFDSLPLSRLGDHQKNKLEAKFLTSLVQSLSDAITLKESSDLSDKQMPKFKSYGHGAISEWSTQQRDYWVKECSRYYYRAAALLQSEHDRIGADEMFRATIAFRKAHGIPEDSEIAQCLEIVAWNDVPDGDLLEAANFLQQAIKLRQADYDRYRADPETLKAAASSKDCFERDSKKLREVQQLCGKRIAH
jgi:tetratricopeptide (TPR) repeat protein